MENGDGDIFAFSFFTNKFENMRLNELTPERLEYCKKNNKDPLRYLVEINKYLLPMNNYANNESDWFIPKEIGLYLVKEINKLK